MSMDPKTLDPDELSADEKRALPEADPPPTSWLTEAQRAELRRRIADSDANPDDYVTWEEVQASIRKRLGR